MRRKARLSTICVGALALVSAAWTQPPSAKQDDAEREAPGVGVARRGTATVEDAYRQFLSLAVTHGRVQLKQDEDELSFDEVAAQLEALGIIDCNWSFAAQTCLTRDVLAYMSASYLGCRPGLITGVFGMTRRYAHREMVYRGIVRPGAPGTFVSGSELLSVATRVSRRVEAHRDVKLNDSEIH